MSQKRKRSVLSIEDKQTIINRLDKGEKGPQLVIEYGISKQQLSDIRKNREKIKKFADSLETQQGLKRKSLKLASDDNLEKSLFSWFVQERSKGTPVSGILLQEKAKHFHALLNPGSADDFKASGGWLENFKHRHGIRNLRIVGEKLSAAEDTVEPFLEKLKKVIEEKQLTPEQIYNADETGLMWKCLPNKTIASAREKSAPGFKASKDRLTVLGCANATGSHKLKPVLIGKYAKPRCFKNVNVAALPVSYKSQGKAWMNSAIFSDWFNKEFVPGIKHHQRSNSIRNPKALLLMDNCSAHPDALSSSDGSITCMFLPPNTTSILQPMDQGVLQGMKTRYKKKLLQQVINEQNIDPTASIQSILKKHNIKDAVYLLAQAWEEATPESIRKSFKKLRVNLDEPSVETDSENTEPTEVLDLAVTLNPAEGLLLEDIEDWLNEDSELATTYELTDEEIVASTTTNIKEENDQDEDCNEEEDKQVTAVDAVDAFQTCLSWLEKQKQVEPVQLMQLRRMLDFAVKTRCNNLK